MSKDKVCLADNVVFSTDSSITGVNDNVIVGGPTGSGKTVSYAEARLLHTFDSSVVVPLAKKRLKKEYMKVFKDRGYDVILDIDFSNPEVSNIGYDPLDFVHNDEDIMQLAMEIANFGDSENNSKKINADPYWAESAANVIAAVIHLLRINEKHGGKHVSFYDVMTFINQINAVDGPKSGTYCTNMDFYFIQAEKKYPGNMASRLWKCLSGNAPKTAGCIMSIVHGSVDKLFSDRVLALVQKKKKISFSNLGKKKTVLFITTPAMNQSLKGLVNLMYADMFRELFQTAEASANGCLDVPVHIICDDFACGCKINNFDDYISIFRAAKISVSLLIQSESQLTSMYGEHAATTIINNCDTYLYMGGTDIQTCRNISQRINKPLDWVMGLPLEQVLVFRRGSKPIVSRRYQTYSDELYLEAFGGIENYER